MKVLPRIKSGRRHLLALRVKGLIALLLLLLLFVSMLSYSSLRRLTDQVNVLSDQALPALAATMELSTLLEDIIQNAERLITAEVQAARRVAYAATKESLTAGTSLINDSNTVASANDLREILSILATTTDDLNSLIEDKIKAANAVHAQRQELNQWAINDLQTSPSDGATYLLWVNAVRGLVLQSASLAPASNVRMQRRDILMINRKLTSLESDIKQLPLPASRQMANDKLAQLKQRLSGEQGLITTLSTFNQLDLRSQALARQMRVLAGELLHETSTLSAQESERAKLSTQSLIVRAEQDITWLVLAVAFAVLIAGASILYIDRRVIQRLTNLKNAVNAQSEGISAVIPVEDNDEITEISEAVKFFITEIEHRQQRLIASAEQVKDVIRLSPQPMCIAADTEVLFYNEAFKAQWPSLADFSDILLHIPAALLAQDGKTAIVDRHMINYRGDGERWFDLASSPVEWEGRQARQLILVDVTTPVQVEETLRAAREKAEAAARAKSSFLAMMSHEIRSPMNGIISVAEILDRGKLGKEQKKLLGVINQSAETLLTIIDDILDLSKIEAGKLAINNFDFDLHAAITGVVELLAPSFEQKGLKLKLDLHPDLPQHVHGDANRIRQILFNLLGNAAKFTEHGGVTITAAAQPSAVDQRPSVCITISDTGIGITQDVLERLFQPFEQADSSVARQYGGTGLGLSICRRLAELMDGDISVESKPGTGSSFTLTLPLILATTATGAFQKGNVESMAGQQPYMSAPHILVVEDNLINQLVIGKILQELACSYDTADDGLDALEKLEHGQYDLVLTDLRMPKMDGYTLARTIRDYENGERRMPIVAVSADAMEDARAESARSGIDAFLTKPIKLEDVRQCLNSYLR